MTPDDIQRFSRNGTEAYLSFLRANHLGVQAFGVVKIERLGADEPACFKLILQGNLFSPDMISIRLSPPGRDYGPQDLTVVEYDADAKSLIIEVRNQELDLEDREPREVKVVSDLTFLVGNVRNWLAQHGAELQLPQRMRDSLEPHSADAGLPLDDGQRDTVRIALGNPLTYLWGPPGTGKTRHVLAAAVVQLVLAGKKVGIYAPTNTALEQALEAVIAAAEKKGVERGKFLRVGSPSVKFAKNFPEVCEVQGLRQQMTGLQRQKGNYATTLHYRRGATVLNSVPMLQHEIGKLRGMLKRREELGGLLGGGPVKKLFTALKGDRAAWEKELAELGSKIEGQLELIRRTRTESPKLNRIIEALDLTNHTTMAAAAADLATGVETYRRRTAAIAAEHEALTNEEIQQRIAQLDQRIEELKAHALDERIKVASVIGMTLDCHIGRFLDQFIEFDHAFLDEAGYASAVKALTLLRRNLPLTFLGDHKQLGPVFEMNDKNLGLDHNHPAIVWCKSALFLDDLFAAESADALFTDWLQRPEPALRSFTKGHLKKTFRFGGNMAELLGEYVYVSLGLVSAAPDAELRVTCLHAVPSKSPDKKRENSAEVDCIARWLEAHPEFSDGNETAWTILTPYRNQVALLGRRLPQARREERVSTIHKAQGREWDTVFLSVVDGRFDLPYFTDSTNPQSGGLHVINTAISRARKHLVLVCDRGFWEDRPAQLISQVLRRLATLEEGT